MSDLVSIIIRVKNEEKWISSCLRAVFSQKYKNFEVILVDNNSRDNTLKQAKKFKIKIIKIKKFYPGKAINVGIKKSNGSTIVCLSGHCIPTNENWLNNLIKNLNKSDIGGVYGRQEPLSFSSALDKRDLILTFGLDKKTQKKDYFFHNANSAFKRKVWEKFNFDEKLENLEDRVWGKKIIDAVYKIIYEPTASVFHYHGIHQNLNVERAENIVKIMQGLDTGQYFSKNLNLEKLNICCIIPTKGEPIFSKEKSLLEHTIIDAQSSTILKISMLLLIISILLLLQKKIKLRKFL